MVYHAWSGVVFVPPGCFCESIMVGLLSIFRNLGGLEATNIVYNKINVNVKVSLDDLDDCVSFMRSLVMHQG
jgi:hypothetical protein